jgi:hypothetical protein
MRSLAALLLVCFHSVGFSTQDCASVEGIYSLRDCEFRGFLRDYPSEGLNGSLFAFDRHGIEIEDQVFSLRQSGCDQLQLVNREWAATPSSPPVRVGLGTVSEWTRLRLRTSQEWETSTHRYHQRWSLTKLADGSLRYQSRIRVTSGLYRPSLRVSCLFYNTNQP